MHGHCVDIPDWQDRRLAAVSHKKVAGARVEVRPCARASPDTGKLPTRLLQEVEYYCNSVEHKVAMQQKGHTIQAVSQRKDQADLARHIIQ